MTAKEIIRALDCCYGLQCENCLLKGDSHCGQTLKDESIKLIESLMAENDKLKAEIRKPVCMPGDTVYLPATGGKVYPATVRKIIYDTSRISFDEDAIGKQVFLTKEAAEQAGTDK